MATKKTETAKQPAEKKTPAPRKPRAKKTETIQLTEAEANALLDAGGEVTDLMTIVKEVKKRKPSPRERDETGKVVRKGRNLSGNQPFQRKHYYYDLEFAQGAEYEKAFQAAPMQVRLILKYMKDEGISTPDDAMVGGDIAGGAINRGYLQSKIEPAALFAYYRRVMERLGLRLASSEGLEE